VTVLRILVGSFSRVHELASASSPLFNVLGAVAWAILIGLLGHLFAHNLPVLRHLLTDTGVIVLGAMVVVGVIAWTRRERTA
jgi:membrane protein DedA with SNARE-associated domain